MKKTAYDDPSGVRQPKNTPSATLNLHRSPPTTKRFLRTFKYRQKASQLEKKTSRCLVSSQNPDLAECEGLNPRGGITRSAAQTYRNHTAHSIINSCVIVLSISEFHI